MGGFLKVYLTGDRAGRYRRFRAIRTAVALLDVAVMLVPLLLSLAGVEAPMLNWVFFGIEVALGVPSVLIEAFYPRLSDGLVEAQHTAYEVECAGEERERYARLYRAYCETRPRGAARFCALLPNLCAAFVFIGVLAWAALFPTLEGVLGLALVLGIVLLSVLCAVVSEMVVLRRENNLYERARDDIDAVKREKGIRTPTGTSRNDLPEAVRAFLKDEADARELTSTTRRYSILTGLLIPMVPVLFVLFTAIPMEETVKWAFFIAAGIILVGAFITVITLGEMAKRTIYRRNRLKLTQSPLDTKRGELQSAWEQVQKQGNRIFLAFLLVAAVAGIALGLAQYFHAGDAEVLYVAPVIFIVIGAILSFVAWGIFFGVKNRRLNALRDEVSILREEERGKERNEGS